MVKAIIITSQAGKKIVPVQKWLLNKYAPRLDVHWIDLKDAPLKDWCTNVATGIRHINPGGVLYFWLDDHLVLDYILPTLPKRLPAWVDRLELGRTWSHHKNCYDNCDFLAFKPDTLYSVSTQPSLWRTKVLLKVLDDVNADPWSFEKRGRCRAGIVKNPHIKFIAETAISQRKPGKVNVNGMKKEDIQELIELGLLNEKELVTSWK